MMEFRQCDNYKPPDNSTLDRRGGNALYSRDPHDCSLCEKERQHKHCPGGFQYDSVFPFHFEPPVPFPSNVPKEVLSMQSVFHKTGNRFFDFLCVSRQQMPTAFKGNERAIWESCYRLPRFDVACQLIILCVENQRGNL